MAEGNRLLLSIIKDPINKFNFFLYFIGQFAYYLSGFCSQLNFNLDRIMEKINVTQLCRELRKNMTDAEKLVWEAVKSNQIKGLKFRRQHPIFFHYGNRSRFFITDFYCGKLKLVIEIDGQIHNKQKTYDNIRDTVLDELGYSVIRIKNERIFKNRNRLGSFLEESIASLTPNPSPQAERGDHE